jgi:hypothetical protein
VTETMTEWAENGADSDAKARKARVKFGPRSTQTVPHEWAQAMLSYLFQHNRKQFGSALQHAAGLIEE